MLHQIVKLILWSGLRGRTRLTMFLARKFRSLQRVPVPTHGNLLFLDLRLVGTHGLLIGDTLEASEQSAIRPYIKSPSIVYDIGAHIGLHTVYFSSLVGDAGEVYAFEPQPDVLDSLRLTVSELSNCFLYEVALSDKNSAIDFYIADEPSMSGIADCTGSGRRITVESVRLDDFYKRQSLPLPDFIKCDIEGAELSCFLGAREIIHKALPVILFEANPSATSKYGYAPGSIMDFLCEIDEANYCFYEIDVRGELVPYSDVRNPFTVHGNFSNILAIPQSRIH